MNVSWLYVFVWLWSLLTAITANEEKKCNSMIIRNIDQLSALHNCTYVDGSLQIVLFDYTKPSDFDISFPLLREITQFLLVYRVSGLETLGKLFPNLMLIRGVRNPTFPGLALMIHDNEHLREIGLYSLTNITQGSVIITKNKKLCSTPIDWGQITNGVNNSTNVINNFNDSSNNCNLCANTGCPEDRCWSQEPIRCQFGKLKGCHPLCAGGCYESNSDRHCFACTAYMHDGRCIKKCPPSLYGHIRTCITEDQCRALNVTREESTPDALNTNYIPFDGVCRDECPYGLEVTPDKNNCTKCTKTKGGFCHRNCNAFKITDEVLRKSAEYRLHANCTTIKSLEIEIKFGTNEDVEHRLEEIIGKVEVISDQLKIIRSYSLTSLNFLHNLLEIRGENTPNKMALVVHGNKNLQRLWTTKDNKTRAVKILNGTVSFHYNPKLCMSEIYKFGNLSTLPTFTNLEVSDISNGDRFECTVYNLVVETTSIESQSIVIQVHKPVEVDNLERFLVYFIEASKWNETIDTSECEESSWKIDDISSKKLVNGEIFHVITNLEPNTEYIYYVKTYTISSKTSMSSQFRNKTLPAKPSAPQYFTAHPVSSSQVELTWKPPSHPHGEIFKYIIKGFHLIDDQSILDQRNYCKNNSFRGDGVTYNSSLSIVKPSFNDQTCNKQCEPQKNNTFDICNSFEHGIDIDLIPLESRQYVLESCNNFLNMFTNEKCKSIQNDHDPIIFPNNANNTHLYKNCSQNWSISNIHKNVTYSDGSLSQFFLEFNDSVTSYNLSSLRHYSQYVLSILVCRKKVSLENNLSRSIDNCSQETVTSFRTLKNIHADSINFDKIQVHVNNRTVNISWEVPSLVNSLVHSFHLKYKRIEAHNFLTICITMKEYKNASRSYVIQNTMPGDYEFQIQAFSLAGEGPLTSLITFNVADMESSENLHLILMIFLSGFILIVFTGIIIRTYFNRQLSQRNGMYNLANNPGYVGIYVEDEWEVARENVIIQKVLGRGTFGTVHEGILMPQNIPCAVKSVSKTNFLRYHAEFLNEAAIMKKFSEAYHIVKLLGVVTKSHPPLLIMELMGLGDLKSVLVKSKEGDSPNPPSRYTIIRMAAQIADGMAFLEYNKFIHRDLAARNCMVANDMTVKIGDFGMSRQIYTGDYYRKGNKGEMPIRWMAPESLGEGIFTSQSDVWSYGVVIWEMMTLGAQPYAGKSNNEVMAHVLDGNLLTLPIFCPDVLSGIVKMCWNWVASQRPKFLRIVEILDIYLDDNFRSVSFYHTRNADEDSPADASLMSPCTTYEEDIDNESVCFEGGDTVAVYSAFHVDKNKMSNGHLSPM